VFKLILAVAAAAMLAGSAAFGAQAEDDARVRVVHASPDAPAVDVYANGSRVLSNVPFKGASDYLNVPAGNYSFEVRAAGAAADSSPVLSVSADLQVGTDYTVMAVDRLTQIEARLFIDDNSAPATGKAHVQVVHASPDAPTVDIGVKGGPILVPGLPFGELKGPLPVEAGTYDLEIRLAGTSTVALPVDGIRLEAGKIYTFTAVGLASGEPSLSVLPLVYEPQPITLPGTGDGGLLTDASADSASYLPWAAVGVAIALSAVFAARTILVRARK
jgi:hypothetical protein